MCLRKAEPRHQPRRQRRLAGAILGNFAEFLFQELPSRFRPRQIRERILHVDDLIEPRTKHILLAGLSSLPWPHQILHASLPPADIYRLQISRELPIAELKKSMWKLQFPASPVAGISPFPVPIKRFRIFHGRLNKMIPDPQSLTLPLLRCANTARSIGLETVELLAKQFGLTEAETTQLLPSGK